MVVVDTSVWVDFFNGVDTPGVTRLEGFLGRRRMVVGDLILAELLAGFRTDREAKSALEWLEPFDCVTMGGPDLAIEAAANYRHLRRKGVTVRKTIDVLIGTYCLKHGLELLHADRDFDAFARHLGLRVAA